MGRTYSFMPDIQYLKETMELSARDKLLWLREANEFIRKYVSKGKLKVWEKFRTVK